MRGYASPQRINDWPVLMVVWDREAEAVFQQVGGEAGVPMLTSTVERTKKYKVVGDSRGAGPCMGRRWASVERVPAVGRFYSRDVWRRHSHGLMPPASDCPQRPAWEMRAWRSALRRQSLSGA